MTKSGREIMEILEAFNLTRCAHSAARLAGCDEKTVARYVAIREAGGDPLARPRRPRSIDVFMAKVEEWVEHSQGRVRADVVHQRLTAMGFAGTERTTRRAVAEAKAAWRAGHRRSFRPWIPFSELEMIKKVSAWLGFAVQPQLARDGSGFLRELTGLGGVFAAPFVRAL